MVRLLFLAKEMKYYYFKIKFYYYFKGSNLIFFFPKYNLLCGEKLIR